VAKVYPEIRVIREIRGFVWDKNGTILDKLGALVAHVGAVWAHVGIRNVTHWTPKNRISSP